MIVAIAKLCAYCVRHEARGIDEDGVPICVRCESEEVPEPTPINRIDRVLSLVHRTPGITQAELAEMMDVETSEERASLTQILSRCVRRGQARAEGPRSARRYYVDRLLPASMPRLCTWCSVELTPDNSTPKRNGIEKQCTSCKGHPAIDDVRHADAPTNATA